MPSRRKSFNEFTPEDFKKFRQNFVRASLRHASFRWPWRTFATQKARVGRGQYKCAGCGKIVGNGEKQLDHIAPVVDPTIGFVSWDVFVERLYVPTEGFQLLCGDCHEQKTLKENAGRKRGKKRS